MSIGREFMQKTCHAYLGKSDQDKGLPQPPFERGVGKNQAVIDLPVPDTLPNPSVSLRSLVEGRLSHRRYAATPLTLAELSYLLWCTQGVKVVLPQATRRTVPSAGSRHAFETFILANRVDGLAPGLYRFMAVDHVLAVVDTGAGLAERVMAACLDQKHVTDSAAMFIWTADVYRMAWRYGERGYRYLLLDAGHTCQNLYLAAESIRCGVCAIAAFDDDALNTVLGLDGEQQFALYAGTVGKKKKA
jgi:SagB-type dehydrogenase family enzyme